jgi:mannose-6-phosphate isomerase-like protein (cupin superfamily)
MNKIIYPYSIFKNGEIKTKVALEHDLYDYKVYAGHHEITVQKGKCVYFLSKDKDEAHLLRGPKKVTSYHMATVIHGYMPPNRSASLVAATFLPYINGCSTRQIFTPERTGDPTLQMLYMPPHSSEQEHHIHSTVRVVYVLSGRGRSVIGMNKKHHIEILETGMTLVLESMCPHHFETDEEHLVVVPLHIFSSSGNLEFQHPMFTGTHLIGGSKEI